MNDNNNCLTKTSILNAIISSGERTLILFIVLMDSFLALGWVIDHASTVSKVIHDSWFYLIWLASGKGQSFIFTETGAMLAMFVMLWIICVLEKLESDNKAIKYSLVILFFMFLIWLIFYFATMSFDISFSSLSGTQQLIYIFIQAHCVIVVLFIFCLA